MIDMNKLRRFAGVDPESDATALSMCLKAAQAWYEGAGVPAREDSDDYDFWVCNLTAWFYDNRGAAGPEAEIPPFILHSVHQLRTPRAAPPAEGADGE